MTILEHLERLDTLILEKTKGTATAALRNQLTVVREQVEAIEKELLSLKNDHKVLKNQTAQEIAELKEEKTKLSSAAAESKKPKVHRKPNVLR
jgi:chromosome segregation ATPase